MVGTSTKRQVLDSALPPGRIGPGNRCTSAQSAPVHQRLEPLMTISSPSRTRARLDTGKVAADIGLGQAIGEEQSRPWQGAAGYSAFCSGEPFFD
jgi:hypothetical protein